MFEFKKFEELYLEPSRNGLTRPSKVRGKGIKMINMGEMFSYSRIDNPPMELVDVSVKEFENFSIQSGDLIFARQSLVAEGAGKCSIVLNCPEPTVFESHLIRIRLDNTKADSNYYYYYFSSEIGRGIIQGLVMEVAASGIRGSDLAKIKVLYPPLPTQHRIASILSAYDDLIEVNNQRIKLLEETARELYKEWFVRMRFPGHKEAKFVKGVPEGWEVTELHELGKIFTGKTPPTKVKDYYGGDIPFIKTPDLHKNQFIFETEEYLTEKGNNTQKRSTLPKGSICVSCIGTGGIVGITTAEKSQTNQQINSLIPNDKKSLEYLFYSIMDLRETIEMYGYTGATMTNLSKGKFEKLKIVFANKKLVYKYSDVVNPMFEQIQTLQQQNTELRQIRDRLLPRLISGKLELK